jgi:hypothetical protein
MFGPINYRESCEYLFELSWIFMKRNNVVNKKKIILSRKKMHKQRMSDLT